MKNLFLIFYISIFSLTSSFVLGNSMDDLVWRDGIAYKKFTNIPYSGEVTGEHQGHFKNGKQLDFGRFIELDDDADTYSAY